MPSLRLLIALAIALVLPPSAGAGTTFLFSGHGWGHGIGMSQYGAYGFARAGWSHERILAHYYPGTTLGRSSTRTVRVLVREDVPSLVVRSGSAFVVTDADGRSVRRAPGALTLGRELAVRKAGRVLELTPPLRVRPTREPLSFGLQRYRGTFEIRRSGGRLQGVNVVSLEDYLRGVVPREVPADWHAQALQAQAVAARTYALVTSRGATFDLHDDVCSQVYDGVTAETPTTDAAIRATAGQIVLWQGRPASTFFHSTSGGRTAAVEDVWDSPPVPYLRSVADPHDSLSPHHAWGPFAFSAAQLARRLDTSVGPLRSAAVDTNPSLRVDRLTLRGARGATSASGAAVQTALELRSTWFRVTTLSLVVERREGRRVVVRGLADGKGPFRLHRRAGSGAWQELRLPPRTAEGAFRLRIDVAGPTTLRLSYEPGGKTVLRLR